MRICVVSVSNASNDKGIDNRAVLLGKLGEKIKRDGVRKGKKGEDKKERKRSKKGKMS